MLESGTDPESYITEYTLVYEDKSLDPLPHGGLRSFMLKGLSFILTDFGSFLERPLSR